VQRGLLGQLSVKLSFLGMTRSFGKWEIQQDQILIESKTPLGKGIQGVVLPAKYLNEPVAVKCGHKEIIKQKFAFPFEREFNAMVTAGFHCNIVYLLGICFHESLGEMLVMERCHQNLSNWLRCVNLSSKMRSKILLDIARGVIHLHSKQILHCDLTSSNIMISSDGTAKLIDFGLSRSLVGPHSEITGNIFWSPREVLPIKDSPKIFSKAVDVYSFGIIIWETFSCLHPGYQFEDSQQFLQAVGAGYSLPMPSNCPPEWKTLIRDCCHEEPDMRPSFEDIVQRLKEMNTLYEPVSEFPLMEPKNTEGGYI